MIAEFDFGTEIDRRAVPALKVHEMVLGADGMDLFPGGVADMDFAAPPAVLEAVTKRAGHGVFGYETVPDGLMPALTGWLQTRHGWHVDPSHILRAPNVLNALSMAANLFTDAGNGIIIVRGNLDLLRKRLATLNGVELIEPEGTFLLWIDFRALQLSPDALTAFLRQKAGWAVTRGQSFGPEGEGFARLNIACPRARLDTALQHLSKAVLAHTTPNQTGDPK